MGFVCVGLQWRADAASQEDVQNVVNTISLSYVDMRGLGEAGVGRHLRRWDVDLTL